MTYPVGARTLAMEFVGRTLPPSLNCLNCGQPIDTDGGIYVDIDSEKQELRPVCNEHADDAVGVLVERRSRPENEEEWDEWYVITAVADAD
jgi:hypothetical protein